MEGTEKIRLPLAPASLTPIEVAVGRISLAVLLGAGPGACRPG